PIRTRGGCSCKDRANEEIGICCRSTASVRKPPAPFAPGAGAPARTELTRISGPAVGAPPRCEPPHPFAPGACAPTRTELTRRTGSAVGAPPRCENRQPHSHPGRAPCDLPQPIRKYTQIRCPL